MSRIEAWNFMKKLSDGSATLVVRQKIEAPATSPEQPKKDGVPPPTSPTATTNPTIKVEANR